MKVFEKLLQTTVRPKKPHPLKLFIPPILMGLAAIKAKKSPPTPTPQTLIYYIINTL